MSERRPRGDIAKLPVWAQNYIHVLEQDSASYRAMALAAAPGGDSDTRIWTPEESVGLPPGATIRFGTGYPRIDVRVHEAITGAVEILVMADNRMLILPQASNLIHVRTERS